MLSALTASEVEVVPFPSSTLLLPNQKPALALSFVLSMVSLAVSAQSFALVFESCAFQEDAELK